MKQSDRQPHRLVLVGGGHAHVVVLRSLGLQPEPRLAITLLSPANLTPYSGMLPGLVAGHYTHAECHIDLDRLSRFAGARFIRDRAVGLDLDTRRVMCAQHPPIEFDFLSLDIGSIPDPAGVPGAGQYVLPVKPVDQFLAGWDAWLNAAAGLDPAKHRVTVVGGGAGGVELILSLWQRCRGDHRAVAFQLVTASATVLPTHNPRVQRRFTQLLADRGIALQVGARVTGVRPNEIELANGSRFPTDLTIWATQASVPDWMARAGLRTDDRGFLLVTDTYQSITHPQVFGAGDVATVASQPRPKSGVFAVRAGPILDHNLRQMAAGRPLRPHRIQRHFLSLISTGDCHAVASRGSWTMSGNWVWHWKDWIDRRFMRRFQELPDQRS